MAARAPTWTLAPLLLAGALLGPGGCCAPGACAPDRLPVGGVADTPSALFALVQHAGRNGCDDLLYELLSPRSRGEVPRWKFTTFWDSDEAIVYPPPPVDPEAEVTYSLAEVLKGAELEYASTRRPLVFVRYERPPERGRRFPEVVFQLLVVEEPTPLGTTEWRLGLVEQSKDGPGYIDQVIPHGSR